MSQPLDKPKQPKLLPGRKPIIQIAERPILQQPQNIIQPKMRPKYSVPESSIILESSWHHDKAIPVPNYVIPQTMSGGNSMSRAIKRKTMQDTRREIPAHADHIYRPSLKPTETPLQEIPRKLTDLDTDINTDFEENPISRRFDIRNVPMPQ